MVGDFRQVAYSTAVRLGAFASPWMFGVVAVADADFAAVGDRSRYLQKLDTAYDNFLQDMRRTGETNVLDMDWSDFGTGAQVAQALSATTPLKSAASGESAALSSVLKDEVAAFNKIHANASDDVSVRIDYRRDVLMRGCLPRFHRSKRFECSLRACRCFGGALH